MHRIQTPARQGNGGTTLAAVLATVRGGERACIVERDEHTASLLAARLRGEGLQVSLAGRCLEIDPTDMLH